MIKKTTTKKDVDCVKTIRKSREGITQDTEEKPPKEILEYFRKRKIR